MKYMTTKEIINDEFDLRDNNELLYVKNKKWFEYYETKALLLKLISKIEFYGLGRKTGYINLNDIQWNHIKKAILTELETNKKEVL